MRIVKWGAITLFSIVVLAVGALLILGASEGADRMAGVVEIARPPQVVWSYLQEPEKLKSWVGWLVEVRNDLASPSGVGHRQTWVMEDRNNGNTRMEITGEVVAYELGKTLTVRVATPGMFTGETTYSIEDLGSGKTRLKADSRYHFEVWYARLMAPLVMPQASMKAKEDLQRLKSVAEKS